MGKLINRSLWIKAIIFNILLCLFLNIHAQRISVSEGSMLYICDDSTISAVGRNDRYQLGDGTNIERHMTVKVKGLHSVVSVNALGSMALLADGTVWQWSRYGTYNLQKIPVNNITQFSVGYQPGGGLFYCVIRSDSSLWIWGDSINLFFDWEYKDSLQKMEVPKIKKVCAGTRSIITLCADSSVWTWGLNGVIGEGQSRDIIKPFKVNFISGAIDIAAGYEKVYAIQNNGIFWASGDESGGFFEFTGPYYFKSIYAENNGGTNDDFFALKNDGSAWTGSLYNISLPFTRFKNFDNATVISVTYYSNTEDALSYFFIKNDGSIWRWGNNFYGQLGNFTTYQIDSPEVMPHPCLAVNCDTITKTIDTLKLDTAVYPGLPVNLKASHSDADLYWWYPRNNVINGKYSQEATVKISDTTEFSAVIMDLYGCMRKERFLLNKKCAPDSKIAFDSVSYPGAKVILEADTGSLYSWTPVTNLSCNICKTTLATISNPVIYTVQYDDTFLCPASEKFIIRIRDCDTMVKIKDTLMLDTLITPGKSIKLRALNAEHYKWSPSTGLNCDTCQAPIARIYDNTEFIATLFDKYLCPWTERFKLTNNCNTSTLKNPVLVMDTVTFPSAQINFILPVEKSYSWHPETGLNCTDCYNPIATITDSIEYIASLTDSFNCVSNEKYIIRIRNCDTIEKNKQAVRLDSIIHYTTEIQLIASISYNGYKWNQVAGLSCNDCQNPILTANATSDYIVEESDQWRCPFNEIFKITMIKVPVDIPNVITPNNDNINDYFEIKGLIPGSNLKIFDDRGRLVFSSENYEGKWNGKDGSGNDLNEGTYWYILIIPGEPKAFKGWVYLKR